MDARFLLARAYDKQDRPELAPMKLKAINQIGRFGGLVSEGAFRSTAGRLYQHFGHAEEALKEYLLLARLEPQTAEHYFHCGELFEERGNSDKALRCYIKATQLDAGQAAAHYKLGHLLYREKRNAEARVALEQAAKHDPDNASACFYLGKVQKDSGDYTAALAAFERAQKSPELKKRALVERGAVYLSMESFERAIAELGRAVRLPGPETDTEALYARYFLSVAYEKTRQLDKAIEQWERIYRLKPAFQDVSKKLSQYQDLRTDDRVKDYITAARDAFVQLCQDAVRGMGFTVNEATDIPNGCQIIATETESKWRNVRKMPQLVWFLRVPELITDSAVRGMMEQMRKARIARGAVYASSGFSRSARDFAESRPINLRGREQLQRTLAGGAAGETT